MYEGVSIVGSGIKNKIIGNIIGPQAGGMAFLTWTKPDGSAAQGNGRYGIDATAGQVIVGGANKVNSTTGAVTRTLGNVISGNTKSGITLNGRNSTAQGNYIGTNAAGTDALYNGGDGITVESGILTVDQSITIGGTSPAERNIISGNAVKGIEDFRWEQQHQDSGQLYRP